MTNLLSNAGFEGGWWRRTHTGQEFGEIFVPEGWVAFWREGGPVPHDPQNTVGYGRPEIHVIDKEPPFLDPPRVRTGRRAVKCFTFYRIHDAGLYQQVDGIEPGSRVRATGWAHAWSSTHDDPHESDGAGRQAFYRLASECADPTAICNFTFSVGIDPWGGNDPWGERVIWGEGAHIYNAFAQVPPVETVAHASTVTVFIRSRVLWPFKHCDAYFDDMRLEVVAEPWEPLAVAIEPQKVVVGQPFEIRASGGSGPYDLMIKLVDDRIFTKPPEVRGDTVILRAVAVEPGTYQGVIAATRTNLPFAVEVAPLPTEEPSPPASDDFIPPREPYVRTYLLLPPDADDAWMAAVQQSGVWGRYRWTVGGSADDAGIGPKKRRVIAVNPERWGSDLRAFFARYYPGVEYYPVRAATPAELLRLLRQR